jgi:hypothetical protein
MKIAGSGAASQRYGSASPDPYLPKCHGSTTLVETNWKGTVSIEAVGKHIIPTQ